MSTQINPYLPPAVAPVVLPSTLNAEPIYFHGSMTAEEGQLADQLMRGKKLAAKTDPRMLLHGILLIFAIFAWLGYEAVVYDELDQLLPAAVQILAVAAVFVGVLGYQKRRDQQHADLKAAEKGVFSRMSGRLSTDGVEFLADDFPVKYEWEDFVGCRISDDVVLLYVDFSKELNFLAASYFAASDQWQIAKALIEQNVPKIRPSAFRAPRAKTPRVIHIAAGVRYLNQQVWENAIAEFDAALAIDATNAEESLVDLCRSVELNPNDVYALSNRGAALIELGRTDEAVVDLERVLEIDPTFERALYHLQRVKGL